MIGQISLFDVIIERKSSYKPGEWVEENVFGKELTFDEIADRIGNLSVRFELDKDKKLYIQTIKDIANKQKGTLLPYKSIVAIADLVDCIPVTKEFMSTLDNDELSLGWYATGRYAWKLENVRAIQPIQYNGKQGLWNADIENIIQFL